jgi:hypothetical protein
MYFLVEVPDSLEFLFDELTHTITVTLNEESKSTQ